MGHIVTVSATPPPAMGIDRANFVIKILHIRLE